MQNNNETNPFNPMNIQNALNKQHANKVKKLITHRRKKHFNLTSKRQHAELLTRMKLHALTMRQNQASSCKTNVHCFFYQRHVDNPFKLNKTLHSSNAIVDSINRG